MLAHSLAGKMGPTFTYGDFALVSSQAEWKLEQSYMSQQSDQKWLSMKTQLWKSIGAFTWWYSSLLMGHNGPEVTPLH